MILFTYIGQSFVSDIISNVGINSIDSYIENINGETGTFYLNRYFRYSKDGINYTDWSDYVSIFPITFDLKDFVCYQYKYISAGTINGNITFNSVVFNSNISDITTDAFKKSFLSSLINYTDSVALNWKQVVLNKFHGFGHVSTFIKRTPDFIVLWRFLINVFAYLVSYTRHLGNFFLNQFLLYKFLVKRNIFVGYNETLVNLTTIMQQQKNEIRRRGTIQIFRKTDTKGELLRLLLYQNGDEFVFDLNRTNSLHFVNTASSMLNSRVYKAYELSKDVKDLSVYPLINNSLISLYNDGVKQVMKLNCNSGQTSGIGLVDLTKAIPVDFSLNYEISFFVKQEQSQNNISFGLLGYDKDNVQLNFFKTNGLVSDNMFFTKQKLNNQSTYFNIKGVLFNSRIPNFTDNGLKIGFGKNLKFNDQIVKIIPVILLDNSLGSTANSLYIWCIKIKAITNPSVYLGVNNITNAIFRNNDFSKSEDKQEILIKTYLVPYNIQLNIKWLPPTFNDYIKRNYSNDYNYDYA